MTVVGWLHWFIAAGGLCYVTGMSAVIGQVGADPVSMVSVIFVFGWGIVWAGVGTGILCRWPPAWYLSISLLCGAILFTLVGSGRNICGLLICATLYAGMLWALLGRHREFR